MIIIKIALHFDREKLLVKIIGGLVNKDIMSTDDENID